jgi:glutamate synthase (NADPH/NADH) small chain
MYGIPEFRLPKEIVKREIAALEGMGVKVEVNKVIGQIYTVDDLLKKGYDAVFIGTGAGLPRFLGVPGENLNGVYSANEFLTRTNLMRAFRFPEYDTPIRVGKRVITVGGGNVAMDSARTALRLGAEESIIVYRRSEQELPARSEEVEHAKEEGIVFQLLTNPTRFIEKDGAVAGVECIRMELGEPDESGRRRPVPIPGSEFTLEVDTVVIAIGNGPHPLIPQTTDGLELTRRGNIVADPETGQTSKEGVFAGGDIVTGAATVIQAMGAGKRAAAAIDRYLQGKKVS